MAALIRGVYAGAPSAVEARRICQALVGSAWSAERGLRSEPALGDAEHELEQVLACIKAAAAIPGVVKVQQAKAWLRSHGERGHKAASQLSKLSSGRNAQCHQVAAQLITDVAQLREDYA